MQYTGIDQMFTSWKGKKIAFLPTSESSTQNPPKQKMLISQSVAEFLREFKHAKVVLALMLKEQTIVETKLPIEVKELLETYSELSPLTLYQVVAYPIFPTAG